MDTNKSSVGVSVFTKKRLIIGLPLLLLLGGVVFVLLVRFGIVKDPFPLANIPLFQKKATVSIKSEYKNPFDKKSQYVNPFEEYKNPFVFAQ